MNAYEINLLGEIYTIQPLANGEYQIKQSKTVLGAISSKLGDLGVTWSGGGISEDLAQQLGELIEEHEM